ncbi:uncharacterized protein LOC120184239 [Hibiscus syriacus]|uniref:uncharacterized protein LOC120184239 n=1 Tax=Hibiscus syriacus TaxID=106335 RepID=UPI0019205C17|nr:uncharacterized protein LOC120184239 [Hibiscus syriacus]
MTMVPAENLSRQHHLPHGGGGGFYGFDCGRSYTEGLGLTSSVRGYDYQIEAYLGSDLEFPISMAEDESRANSDNNNQEQERDKERTRRVDVDGAWSITRWWLTVTTSKATSPYFRMPEFQPPPRPKVINSFSTLFFQQHQQGSSSMIPHQVEINRDFKPIAPSSSSSSSSSSSLAPYFGRSFQVQSMDVAGPSSEVRIIDPPKRPHSGIWFMLQASHNQTKEPFLPQIPKSYLRIKDGKMTVRLIMKYLANKLRLDSESEIEIRCRGQQLEPLLTLQYVRDQIWCRASGQAHSLLPDYTLTPPDSVNNVMVLHYGRR